MIDLSALRGRRQTHDVAAKRGKLDLRLLMACAAAFGATVTVGLVTPKMAAVARRASYQSVYVIDGDTIRMPGGERVRLLGIDAPEMPRHAKCRAEVSRAYEARDRLRDLIRHAHDIELRADGDRNRDVYGRELRHLIIDGRDAGETLIAEGLAQPWRGHHANWC